MMEGTTEPFWSEDLWAQVERAMSKVRTQRRGALSDSRSFRRLQQTHQVLQGCQGSDLSVEYDGGRLATELRGA
jgi:hypothetical protein